MKKKLKGKPVVSSFPQGDILWTTKKWSDAMNLEPLESAVRAVTGGGAGGGGEEKQADGGKKATPSKKAPVKKRGKKKSSDEQAFSLF